MTPRQSHLFRTITRSASLALLGACLGTSVALAQAPTPRPAPKPAPTPVRVTAPTTTSTTTAPSAGGFPLELAAPLLAGGATAIGSGVLMLRRGRQRGS